jgi:hypothetical protein
LALKQYNDYLSQLHSRLWNLCTVKWVVWKQTGSPLKAQGGRLCCASACIVLIVSKCALYSTIIMCVCSGATLAGAQDKRQNQRQSPFLAGAQRHRCNWKSVARKDHRAAHLCVHLAHSPPMNGNPLRPLEGHYSIDKGLISPTLGFNMSRILNFASIGALIVI